jgi:prevent-host-death family protein
MVYNIGMTKVSTAVARKRFSDVVNRASYAKERVALTRYGHTLAAIVPAEDLALLEAMEDRIDADDAREASGQDEGQGRETDPAFQGQEAPRSVGRALFRSAFPRCGARSRRAGQARPASCGGQDH